MTAAKPTALKILEGNPGKRALNKNEPKPEPVAPKCPAWLDLEAKREWKRMAPQLERLGLLTIIDGAVLAGYCQAYAEFRKATEELKVHGRVHYTDNGYPTPRPEVAMLQKSLQLIRAFCSEFGLSPSSRGRMTVPGKDEKDDWEKLLD